MDEGFRFPFSNSLSKFCAMIKGGGQFLLKSLSEKSNEKDPAHEYQKALHAAYVAQRAEADKCALEIAGRYERMLSLIAGGALAVSLTFIEKIAPSPVPYSRWFALMSWISLTIALIASLFAISQSQNAVQKKMVNLDIEIGQALYPDDERYKGQTIDNPFIRRVTRANVISLWTTVAGLILMIAFAFINFSTPNQNERQETNTTAKSTGSQPTVQEGKLHPSDKPSSTTTASSKAREIEDERKTESASQVSSTNEGGQGVLYPTAKPSSTATPAVPKEESRQIESELKTKTLSQATFTSEGAQGELRSATSSAPKGSTSEKVR